MLLRRAEEQEDTVDGSSGNFLQDVLNGSTLTKARSGQHPVLQNLLLPLTTFTCDTLYAGHVP